MLGESKVCPPINYFPKKEGFLKLMSNTLYITRKIFHVNNLGGHSSFVFPHLCLAKVKCVPLIREIFHLNTIFYFYNFK